MLGLLKRQNDVFHVSVTFLSASLVKMTFHPIAVQKLNVDLKTSSLQDLS